MGLTALSLQSPCKTTSPDPQSVHKIIRQVISGGSLYPATFLSHRVGGFAGLLTCYVRMKGGCSNRAFCSFLRFVAMLNMSSTLVGVLAPPLHAESWRLIAIPSSSLRSHGFKAGCSPRMMSAQTTLFGRPKNGRRNSVTGHTGVFGV